MIKICESSTVQFIYRQIGLKIEQVVSSLFFFFFPVGMETKRKLADEEKEGC